MLSMEYFKSLDYERMTLIERQKVLADFLNYQQTFASLKAGRQVSQSALARQLEMPQGTLSQYMRGNRLPDEENRDRLAATYGVIIYDICGTTRKLPDDKELRRIAISWGDIPKDWRKKIADQVEDLAIEQEGRYPKSNPIPSKA